MNEEMIKAAYFAKGSQVISKQRAQIIEDFETLLPVFIDDKQVKVDILCETVICDKALGINNNLVRNPWWKF